MIYFLRRIKRFFDVELHSKIMEKQLAYDLRNYQLIDKTLYCNESGVSNLEYCSHEIIVSLTTYGKRLNDVASTIESIMQGSMKPNRIVLWLEEDLKNTVLPITLQQQQKRGLEIAYCKDIRSYKKLIPTLRKYPEAVIITIDDDAIYNYDLVEKLVNMHNMYPNNIIANRIHRVVLGPNGKPKEYMKWDWGGNPTDASPLNFFTGVGGVLYPPHALDVEVFNEEVFMDICKYADDIWFYAMALKKGTYTIKGYTHNDNGVEYITNPYVQDIGLCKINTGKKGENNKQLKSVFDFYNLWDKLIHK